MENCSISVGPIQKGDKFSLMHAHRMNENVHKWKEFLMLLL
jgi:hypothetical protein